jgi:hypothetical protein
VAIPPLLKGFTNDQVRSNPLLYVLLLLSQCAGVSVSESN